MHYYVCDHVGYLYEVWVLMVIAYKAHPFSVRLYRTSASSSKWAQLFLGGFDAYSLFK